jgi:hypothetical protein
MAGAGQTMSTSLEAMEVGNESIPIRTSDQRD